jgi:hypothetical protein
VSKDIQSFVEKWKNRQKTKRSDRDIPHNRFIPNDLSSFNLSYFGQWFLITDRIFFIAHSLSQRALMYIVYRNLSPVHPQKYT